MIYSRALHPKLLRLLTIQTFANTTKVPNPFTHHENHDHHDSHDHHDHHHSNGRSRPPVEYNTITSFLDHKNLNTYFECKCITKLSQRDLDTCTIQGSTTIRPMVSPMIGGMIPITIRIIRFPPRILVALTQRLTCGLSKAN